MLHQPATNQLQRQSNYGLTRSSSGNKSTDLHNKGSRKSTSRTGTNQNENPFALRARDVNISNEKLTLAVPDNTSGKKPHFGQQRQKT